MNAARPGFAVVGLLLGSLALGAGGCGSGGGGAARHGHGEAQLQPKPPPAGPARRDVPIDPALRQAARQELLGAAKASSPLLRAHAIEGMRDALGPEADAAIVKALSDDAPLVRFAASLAAGELRLKDAHNELLVLSDDADPSVRVGAKFALHRIGDTRQSHDLEATAKDPQARVRGDTPLVLGLLGEPSGVKLLMPMLSDLVPAVRLQAAEALWRLGSQNGLEALISASISKFPDDQMIALLALAGPKDRRVLGHVEGALTNEYEEVSLVAARAAGMLGSDAGYGVALKGVGSSDPRQRMLAALALGAIGRSDAQPDLARLLKDSDADVRIAAATAILQLKQQ
jgi:HEAT repeat protein